MSRTKFGTPLHYAAGKSVGIRALLNYVLLRRYQKTTQGNNKSYKKFVQWVKNTTTHVPGSESLNGNIPPVFSILLDAGASVIERNDHGITPLHAAAAHTLYTAVIKMLVEYGAEVNARDGNGMTPLHYAAWINSNPDILSLLLEHGANMDADANANRPIHYAAVNVHPQMLEFFLKRGVNVNARNMERLTALHMAAGAEDVRWTSRLLLEYGADINSKGELGKTPLHEALLRRNFAIASMLLAYGADGDIGDGEGITARGLMEHLPKPVQYSSSRFYERLIQDLLK